MTGLHHLFFRRLLKGLERFRAYGKEQCTRAFHESPSIARNGVFQKLITAKNAATGTPLFRPSELPSESSLLIIAGSDTTSTALSATLFYLLHNPACLLRAQAEVIAAF